MRHKPNILHLEDDLQDVELIASMLAKGGVDVDVVHVKTEADFIAALEKNNFDLVMVGYSIPSYDGLSALATAQQLCPNVPFIIVSGKLGEEHAIDILKTGATDYVLKQNLAHLVPAVKRALRESEDHKNLSQIKKELYASEEKLRLITNSLPALIAYIDTDLRYLYANEPHEDWFGVSQEDVPGKYIREIIGDSAFLVSEPFIKQALSGKSVDYDIKLYHHNMGTRLMHFNLTPHIDKNGLHLGAFAISTDITEQKKAEEELKKYQHDLKNLTAHLQTVREEERKTIAREIHDELGQILSALKIDVFMMHTNTQSVQTSKDSEKKQSMLDLIEKAITTVQKISARLRPDLLEHLGLFAAVEWESREFEKKNRNLLRSVVLS